MSPSNNDQWVLRLLCSTSSASSANSTGSTSSTSPNPAIRLNNFFGLPMLTLVSWGTILYCFLTWGHVFDDFGFRAMNLLT